MMRATTWLLAAGLLVCAGALAVWSPLGWTAADRIVERARDAAGIVNADVESGGAGLYTCSMHPHVLRHEPGDCPICRMELVPVETDTAVPAGAGAGDAGLYTCSMHPHVLRHEPGDCPICRMDLVPVETDAAGPAESRGVRMNQGFLQSFGVRTTRVERGSLPVAIRTVGALAHNERNVFSVNTKFGGWIERARVNNVGERVTAGDVLFEIYSPDLVTTQHEYLTAMDYIARLRERDAYDGALLQAASLVDAARARLLHADMTTQAYRGAAGHPAGQSHRRVRVARFRLHRGEDRGLSGRDAARTRHDRAEDRRSLHPVGGGGVLRARYSAPARGAAGHRHRRCVSGTALGRRHHLLPARHEPGHADVDGLRRSRQRGSAAASADVRDRRTARARAQPTHSSCRRTHVLHRGDRAVVVVARGDGYFTPREVRLGLASDGRQQVTEGLDGGEEIVVSSQFLIDSESNLKAAIAQLLGERAEGERVEAGSGRQ